MLRYEARGEPAIAARRGLRIITIGEHAELRDHEGHLHTATASHPAASHCSDSTATSPS